MHTRILLLIVSMTSLCLAQANSEPTTEKKPDFSYSWSYTSKAASNAECSLTEQEVATLLAEGKTHKSSTESIGEWASFIAWNCATVGLSKAWHDVKVNLAFRQCVLNAQSKEEECACVREMSDHIGHKGAQEVRKMLGELQAAKVNCSYSINIIDENRFKRPQKK